ncbi:conserved hypothetical protein [Ricinus communis]|uniref:Uncharacterized protein n=1 Tax=Ricinus communis TaxID=3988 RepID=B9T0I3_RICCO|nr:conserved hypothetical protein [Ricinus communis]
MSELILESCDGASATIAAILTCFQEEGNAKTERGWDITSPNYIAGIITSKTPYKCSFIGHRKAEQHSSKEGKCLQETMKTL